MELILIHSQIGAQLILRKSKSKAIKGDNQRFWILSFIAHVISMYAWKCGYNDKPPQNLKGLQCIAIPSVSKGLHEDTSLDQSELIKAVDQPFVCLACQASSFRALPLALLV